MEKNLVRALEDRAANCRLEADRARDRGMGHLVGFFDGKAEAFDIAAAMAASAWYERKVVA